MTTPIESWHQDGPDSAHARWDCEPDKCGQEPILRPKLAEFEPRPDQNTTSEDDFTCCRSGRHIPLREHLEQVAAEDTRARMRAAAEATIPGTKPADAEDTGTLFWEQARQFRDHLEQAPAAGSPQSHPLYGTQLALDTLAEQIGARLDDTLHLYACWISEDETRCECIIGALRAVLPRCGHVEQVGIKGRTRQCLSIVHPSAPHKHVFGTV